MAHTPNSYSNSPSGRYTELNKIYVGFVRDNKDAINMGRLQVWIPEISPDPDKPEHWITVNYASPFAGGTPVDDNIEENDTFKGTQKSYGFWMIPPDIDNEVICAFLNGDPNRGIWFGCLYHQYMDHQTPGIAANKLSNQDKEGPASEYNKKNQQINLNDPIRPQYQPLRLGLERQGLDEDFSRGQSRSSARRNTPSTVYGVLTPRGNQIVYDDGFRDEELPRTTYDRESNPANEEETASNKTTNKRKSEFIRHRTRSGAQVLISETDGFVYFISRDGKSWIEINNNGEVDIWGFDDVSIRSNQNINMMADKDVNIEAGNNINMKASKNWTAGGGQVSEDQGNGGDINVEARNNMNYKVVKDWNTDTGKNWYNKVGENWNTQAGKEINQKSGSDSKHTSGGTFHTKASGQIIETASQIHMNGPSASEAADTQEVDKIPQQNLKDKDARNAKPLKWPENQRKTITKRIPQHEPYLAHDITTKNLKGRVSEIDIAAFNKELNQSSPEAQAAASRASHKPGSSPNIVQTPQGDKVKTGTTKPRGSSNQSNTSSQSNKGKPVYQTKEATGEFAPPSSLETSESGKDFIAKHEGYVGEVYSDVGNPAIGYGHNLSKQEQEQGYIEVDGEKIDYTDGLSRQEADKVLDKDIKEAEQAVRNNVNVKLTQQQYDSLVSFTYNVGTDGFKRSTMLKELNKGNYENVPSEMARWNIAGGQVNAGLVKRRDSEAELFTGASNASS